MLQGTVTLSITTKGIMGQIVTLRITFLCAVFLALRLSVSIVFLFSSKTRNWRHDTQHHDLQHGDTHYNSTESIILSVVVPVTKPF